jgi:hypothetical protein
MPLEGLLNDPALNTLPATVNEANFAEASVVRGVDVLLDHRPGITRCEGVQVEGLFDWNAMSHGAV